MGEDLATLAREFRQLGNWMSSPLYQSLGPVVADDPGMLEVISRRRPGQVPVSVFFAAVHYLLLSGVEHELSEFYPSIVGKNARGPDDAGPALRDFFLRHQAEIDHLVSTGLVQKHVVKRSAVLRLGMWAVGREVDVPVHLIEVGASAGIHLRFDRYRYDIGGAFFGDPASPVFVRTQWRGGTPVPDLDELPRLASATGIDLHPIDASLASQRQWLRALVWPEEVDEGVELDTALSTVAADPPTIIAGDVIDVGASVAASIPRGEPRVVFHAATRLHVPPERADAFDAAIAAFGDGGPLFHLSQERAEAPHAHPVLALRRPGASELVHLAFAEGYGNWIEPLDLPN